MELKGGNLLVAGQRASSAPAQSHRGLEELGPAQVQHNHVPWLIRNDQLPSDAQVSRIRQIFGDFFFKVFAPFMMFFFAYLSNMKQIKYNMLKERRCPNLPGPMWKKLYSVKWWEKTTCSQFAFLVVRFGINLKQHFIKRSGLGLLYIWMSWRNW